MLELDLLRVIQPQKLGFREEKLMSDLCSKNRDLAGPARYEIKIGRWI